MFVTDLENEAGIMALIQEAGSSHVLVLIAVENVLMAAIVGSLALIENWPK